MAKKKAVKKAKKAVKKSVKVSKKSAKGGSASHSGRMAGGKVVKVKKEKPIGKITHYFDKISVAAIKILSPIKVGDYVRIKGHTTDFVQKIDSMQIEHQNVLKAKKGDEIGIKSKEYVRDHDLVYAAKEKDLAIPASQPVVQAKPANPPAPQKPADYSSKKFMSF